MSFESQLYTWILEFIDCISTHSTATAYCIFSIRSILNRESHFQMHSLHKQHVVLYKLEKVEMHSGHYLTTPISAMKYVVFIHHIILNQS